MTSNTLSPIRFAGRVPNAAAAGRSPEVAQVLADVFAGNMTVEAAAQLRLKDIKPLLLNMSAEVLRMDKRPETAYNFLLMARLASDSTSQQSADARVLGWTELQRAVSDGKSLAPSLWDEKHMSMLLQAISSVPMDCLDTVRSVVFAVVEGAPDVGLDRRGYSVKDRLVGDFLDRKWESHGKKTTDEFRSDIQRAIELAPRSAMWLRVDQAAGPHMTRANFDRALDLLRSDPDSKAQAGYLVARAPLDWIEPQAAFQRICEQPIRVQDVVAFEGATPEHAKVTLSRVLARDFDRYDQHLGLDRISELPHLRAVVDNTEWMHEVSRRPLDGSSWLVKLMAEQQSDSRVGHDMLLTASRVTIAHAQRLPDAVENERVASAVRSIFELVGPKHGKASDSTSSLSASDVAQLTIDSGVSGLAGSMAQWHWRDNVERAVKSGGLDKAERDILLGVLVQVHAVGIEALPKADQRLAVLGGALKQDPGRLSEITDFEIFKRLARQLDIPIEVPDRVDAARLRRDQALAAIEDSSPTRASRPT